MGCDIDQWTKKIPFKQPHQQSARVQLVLIDWQSKQTFPVQQEMIVWTKMTCVTSDRGLITEKVLCQSCVARCCKTCCVVNLLFLSLSLYLWGPLYCIELLHVFCVTSRCQNGFCRRLYIRCCCEHNSSSCLELGKVFYLSGKLLHDREIHKKS